MGYVKAPALTTEKLNNANFEIEIATERYSAQASLRSLYDPNNEKLQL